MLSCIQYVLHKQNIFYFAMFPVVSWESKEVNLTEEGKSAIVLEVQTMFQEYFDAVRRGGLKGEFKYLDHSNVSFGFHQAIRLRCPMIRSRAY